MYDAGLGSRELDLGSAQLAKAFHAKKPSLMKRAKLT
jgi:hypothetical protein